MEPDEEGFLYPRIDEQRCVECKSCVAACPVLNRPLNHPWKTVFAAYASDESERMSSSSGGVFAVLARTVLAEGGAVCGAAYRDDVSVHHVLIEDEKRLKELKGTKYIQSSTDQVFSEVKDRLHSGRQVLFSGTPCQVAGLKAFLGKDWDNLLCVDLICHGVPSPAVWQDYLHELSPTDPIVKAAFRYKKENSEGALIRFKGMSGQELEEKQSDNLYMKGFLQNCYVRPSCFDCQFKGLERCSDITIGDFWSIREFHSEFADKYGNSAVIVHSEKGKRWLERVLPNLRMIPATEKEVLLWNECLVDSVKRTEKRDAFYARWHQKALLDILSELTAKEAQQETKKTLLSKIKSGMKRILK